MAPFPAVTRATQGAGEGRVRTMPQAVLHEDAGRRHAEDAVAGMMSDEVESSSFLAHILESSTEYSIIAKDLERRILSWNSGARRNYGYEAHEVLGKSSDLLHHPTDIESGIVHELHQKALEDGQAEGTFHRLRKDGSMFLASVVITRRDDAEGRPMGYLVISRDATEEENLRRQADEHRRFLDNILESSTQYSIIATDIERNIVRWNAGARRNYGYGAHEVLGRNSDILHEDIDLESGVVERMHRQALVEGSAEGVFHRRRKDGSAFTASVVITRRDNAEGRPAGYLLISRDITQEQELHRASEERQRQLEEADRRKDEFLATLAHELRNPLAPLAMASELLKRDPGPDDQRRFHELIDRQVAHLTRLVNDLLDVSRITRGKIQVQREPTSLTEAVRQGVEIAQPHFERRRQHFTLSGDERDLDVLGDAVRLAQVFGNLLRNASKYTPDGGRIEARVEARGKECWVTVQDTGCGIEPERLPHIFEPFVQGTQANGGLGIGLTLARSIVGLHDGTIEAHSDGPGRGSTFTVRLPLTAPVAVEEPTLSLARGDAKRRTVLVVDDNPDVVEMLASLLRSEGHSVHCAGGGREGIERAHALRPHAIVCDLDMPDVDGYEFARRVRAEPALRDCILVALSGHVQASHRARSRDAGFDEHMAKPASAGDLLAFIESVPVAR